MIRSSTKWMAMCNLEEWSYLVVGVAYIHKEPPPVVDRTHRYELLQLETVCILVRYSNTLTFSAHSNELVT